MSKKKIEAQPDQDLIGNQTKIAPQLARRRLLKGTVAIPVIMTLHSGAALARSSNLVGVAESVDEAAKLQNELGQEQIVCVYPDPDAEHNHTSAPPYDLGEVPTVSLGDGSQELLDQAAICQGDGGILISATAFTSLEGKVVNYTLI